MLPIKTNFKIGASFKLIKHKGNINEPVQESGWSNNIVLDSGLNRMSVGEWINRLCIGSGNSIPSPEQTSLNNFIASTTDRQEWTPLLNTTGSPYYGIRMRYRFAEGQAAGNVSEVGLGWSNSDLWNRALIRDEQNTPVTITVLSDEFLDVITEIKIYPPETFSGSFTLRNVAGDAISTHNFTGRPLLDGTGSIYPDFNRIYFNGNNVSYPTKISTSPMTSGYGDNGGSSIYHSSNTSNNTYPTTTSCRQTVVLYLDTNNYSHKSFSAPIGNLICRYSGIGFKWELDTPIVKTNQNTITYTYEVSWARYTGA